MNYLDEITQPDKMNEYLAFYRREDGTRYDHHVIVTHGNLAHAWGLDLDWMEKKPESPKDIRVMERVR